MAKYSELTAIELLANALKFEDKTSRSLALASVSANDSQALFYLFIRFLDSGSLEAQYALAKINQLAELARQGREEERQIEIDSNFRSSIMKLLEEGKTPQDIIENSHLDIYHLVEWLRQHKKNPADSSAEPYENIADNTNGNNPPTIAPIRVITST